MMITPNRIANAKDIVSLAESYRLRFMDYPGFAPGALFDPYRDVHDPQDDRFHVLRMGYNMPDDLAWLIATSLELSTTDRDGDICLYRYDPGDYAQSRCGAERLGIVVLTSSPCDGMTLADGSGSVRKIADAAGTYIVTDRETWHWVDPMRGGSRYAIVSDRPLRGRIPVKRRGPDFATRPRTTGVHARGATAVVHDTADPRLVLKSCWRTDAYDRFLKLVRSQPSAHLPAIRGISNNTDGRQWVEMERLWPLGESDALWPVVNAFCAYCHAVADRRSVAPPPKLSAELAEQARLLAILREELPT
ncbi:MAG: hypothetical protein VW405_21670, partial [Rhodospirillaceae bacterium]